jgi:16S rRNA processing protein RimM
VQVVVGRIGRPHGIRGDVVVGVRTDEPEARFAVGTRLDTDPAGTGPLTVAATRWQSGELIVRFTGIADRTAAGELTGTWLTVDSGTLDPLEDPDEFRDADLIDLTVRTVGGEVVGVVTDVLHHGQDLLAIRPVSSPASPASASGPAVNPISPVSTSSLTSPTGTSNPISSTGTSRPTTSPANPISPAGVRAEILVPFVKAIVTEVDLAAGMLVIDPPPGLLNLDEAELRATGRCLAGLLRRSGDPLRHHQMPGHHAPRLSLLFP